MTRPASKLAYWIVVPLSALVYTGLWWAFAVDAWSRRGEPKPWWYELAFWLTLPGNVVPLIGPLVAGGSMGFFAVYWVRARRQRCA